ncbi:acyl-CoA dehydrogenase family protein [Streptomyces roseicoloratus]|uniref:acyl-CoA dehydrogenase family protein n=1 Tax=Streptomyces roseicoloratus TaxID=2508722 RepID=UPI001FECACA7|nr:acyl-CoA dehydrogenase family protein [Streptomyces roseicoloratus]
MAAFSLDPEQTAWCAELRALAAEQLRPLADKGAPGRVNRPLVAALGAHGLIGRLFDSGALDLCLMRESLAHACTEAETALALQGLGAHPVAAFGTPDQRARWLPEVVAGRAVAAFALSEPGAGSDAAALALEAVPDPDTDPGGPPRWRLYGEKRWISNAPEADLITVFARTGDGTGGSAGGGTGGSGGSRTGGGGGRRTGGSANGSPRPGTGSGPDGSRPGSGSGPDGSRPGSGSGPDGSRPGSGSGPDGSRPGSAGVTAFLVPADRPGLSGEALDMLAPHALGSLVFDGVPVGPEDVLGEPGQGFRVAMHTLNLFRPSVGAFAVGMAQAALDAALAHTAARPAFGGVLADLQAVAHQVAEMATRTEAARLLVYAAAEAYDRGDPDVPRRAAMAKLLATETAQYVVDAAVQLHGARALQRGHLLEHLYREVRAPRIYEGATEVQRTIIAKELYQRRRPATPAPTPEPPSAPSQPPAPPRYPAPPQPPETPAPPQSAAQPQPPASPQSPATPSLGAVS